MCNVTLTSVIGTTGSSGTDLEIRGTATDCDAVVVHLFENGVWTNPKNAIVDSSGAWSVEYTDTAYQCNDSLEIRACCERDDGSINPNCCDAISATVECPCCPEPTVNISYGACNEDCEVPVNITTSFPALAPGCMPVSMQWKYTDNNNVDFNGLIFDNDPASSPHIETRTFSASQSPISLTLVMTASSGCDSITIGQQIIVPECDGCPEIRSFTHTEKGCITRADRCCRKVEFEIEGIFCGGPEIRIDYGDGNHDTEVISANGLQNIQFENEYCEGGDYTATITFPSIAGCPSRTLDITVTECLPSECFDCCPVASVVIKRCIDHSCNNDQTRDVEITTEVTPNIKPNCPSEVVAEMYINNQLVDSGSGSSVFTLSHDGRYKCGEHRVEIRYPEFDCPPEVRSFCVYNCEKDHCFLYRTLFTLFGGFTLASVLLFLLNRSALPWLGLVVIIAAVLTIGALIAWGNCKTECKKCPLKLAIWQLLAIGFLSFLWLSKSSLLKIHVWLSSFLSPALATIICWLIIVIILIIILLLFLRWKNRCCPSTLIIWIEIEIVMAAILTVVGFFDTRINDLDSTGNTWALLEQQLFGIGYLNYIRVMSTVVLLIGILIVILLSKKNCKTI